VPYGTSSPALAFAISFWGVLMLKRRFVVLLLLLGGCARSSTDGPTTVFVGARIIDGTGADPIENAMLVVRNGRIDGVWPNRPDVPDGATVVDVSGRTIIPGLINTHGHVGATAQTDSPEALRATLLKELTQYARYGVTTVNSLGGEGSEAVAIRDEQATPSLSRARLYVAGNVVTGDTPGAAIAMVDENVALGVDFIKIRVDDNLGSSTKMAPDVYRAVIDQTHEYDLPLAVHIFYLDDAKDLLRAGADLIAHSIRDRPVDEEVIQLFRATGVCYVPTLTREVSTFVYENEPEFFADPFFAIAADTALMTALRDPESQQLYRESQSAQAYKRALRVASDNLKRLADQGVTIAFGTDTGPRARFQGYFEHMEMQLMAEAGLTPMQIIKSATGDAAQCLDLQAVGTIRSGKWADFVVLSEDPLADIRNMRSIESVWIAGNQIPTSIPTSN
ncbi:MAG: amidohydrolase family protein, partial [Gemmatimonadales bacterium]